MKRTQPSAFAGNAGEFFVLAELARRGWTAAPTARNTHAFDILAKRGGKFAAIRVKTKTSISIVFQWNAKRNGEIFSEMSRTKDYCVLVDIPPGDGGPTYYVVPTTVVDQWLRRDFKRWLEKPGAWGQQRAEDNPRRIIYLDNETKRLAHGYLHKLAPYKGAWNLLG